jgi:predicted NodU family carbamoyl transferase
MNILSIQFGHNATVSYMENGQLQYVLQEEKFNNIKNSSAFPLQSLQYISQRYDLKKLDKIAIASRSLPSSLLITDKVNTTKHDIL